MSTPGPEPLPPELKKSERVRIYGNKDEYAKWKAAAEANGETINEMIRRLLNQAAKKHK